MQYLDSEAQYLGTLGEDVTDVSQLYSFEVQQADGLSPITQLGASVDASMPTPGSSVAQLQPVLLARRSPGATRWGRSGWAGPTHGRRRSPSSPTAPSSSPSPGGVQRIFQPSDISLSTDRGLLPPSPAITACSPQRGERHFTLTEQDGTITAYNPDGTLDYVEDTDGNTITASYTNGLLTSLTASSGQYLTIAYNAAGLIASVTDSAGRETTYSYDPTDTYLTSVTTFDGETTIVHLRHRARTSRPKTPCFRSPIPTARIRISRTTPRADIASTSADGGAEMTTFAYGAGGAVAATDALGQHDDRLLR